MNDFIKKSTQYLTIWIFLFTIFFLIGAFISNYWNILAWFTICKLLLVVITSVFAAIINHQINN